MLKRYLFNALASDWIWVCVFLACCVYLTVIHVTVLLQLLWLLCYDLACCVYLTVIHVTVLLQLLWLLCYDLACCVYLTDCYPFYCACAAAMTVIIFYMIILFIYVCLNMFSFLLCIKSLCSPVMILPASFIVWVSPVSQFWSLMQEELLITGSCSELVCPL